MVANLFTFCRRNHGMWFLVFVLPYGTILIWCRYGWSIAHFLCFWFNFFFTGNYCFIDAIPKVVKDQSVFDLSIPFRVIFFTSQRYTNDGYERTHLPTELDTWSMHLVLQNQFEQPTTCLSPHHSEHMKQYGIQLMMMYHWWYHVLHKEVGVYMATDLLRCQKYFSFPRRWPRQSYCKGGCQTHTISSLHL